MIELGWQPYQNDHDDANGQFEMNWNYDDALVTADRHAFFKYMTKAIAEKHGLRATFMPKPFVQLTGNGCHMHVSMWKGRDNAFEDSKAPHGLSQMGLHFIGGIINSADALAAIRIRRSTATRGSMRHERCRARPGRQTQSPGPATTGHI